MMKSVGTIWAGRRRSSSPRNSESAGQRGVIVQRRAEGTGAICNAPAFLVDADHPSAAIRADALSLIVYLLLVGQVSSQNAEVE
jgi:hypothetical protein